MKELASDVTRSTSYLVGYQTVQFDSGKILQYYLVKHKVLEIQIKCERSTLHTVEYHKK